MNPCWTFTRVSKTLSLPKGAKPKGSAASRLSRSKNLASPLKIPALRGSQWWALRERRRSKKEKTRFLVFSFMSCAAVLRELLALPSVDKLSALSAPLVPPGAARARDLLLAEIQAKHGAKGEA